MPNGRCPPAEERKLQKAIYAYNAVLSRPFLALRKGLLSFDMQKNNVGGEKYAKSSYSAGKGSCCCSAH
jgi:hypothetical protein